MNTTSSSTTSASSTQRALVLGGGGSTGNAWLIGVLAGLFDAGLDVTSADVTVGTSAGSTAAAQISGATPPDLFAAILATALPARPSRPPVAGDLQTVQKIIDAAADPADMRRKMGAAALARDAETDGSWQAQWRATVGARLPRRDWPPRTVLITAVDAETGQPTTFDRHSGVELVDAVAASCSSRLPYRIGDHRYIDGGYRANADNADLAAGCQRVLVLSPFGGATLLPLEWRLDLAAQVDELRARGSAVETIFPSDESEHLFGTNAMDLSLRPAAARSGYASGTVVADRLAEFWG